MPIHLRSHVQFIMPPIGSVGSGLASYRDMYCTLKDEKENIYTPISSIMYMLYSSHPKRVRQGHTRSIQNVVDFMQTIKFGNRFNL
jgi:hypothetical protein